MYAQSFSNADSVDLAEEMAAAVLCEVGCFEKVHVFDSMFATFAASFIKTF
jgi:hypothetical protein